MKKRLLIMLLCFVTLMVGCAKVDEGKKTVQSTPKEQTEAKEEKVVSVEDMPVFKLHLAGDEPKDLDSVEAEMNAYLAKEIEAQIDIIFINWGDYKSKVELMVAGGEELDLVFTAGWWGFYENAAKKMFLPLNDLVDEYGQGIVATLPEASLKGPVIDGNLYAIPTYKEMANQYGFIFNQELVEKYDLMDQLKDITSWSEVDEKLTPILRLIKEKEPNFYPYYASNTTMAKLFSEAEPMGVEPGVFYNGEVVLKHEIPEVKQLYKMVYNWMQEGLMNEDAATAESSVDNFFCGILELKPGKADELNASGKAPVIQLELDQPRTRTYDIVGSMMAIARTSQEPEAAMRFLNLLNTDKYVNNLLNFGIEGKHYNKTDENMIKIVDNSTYALNKSWMLQNQFLNYIREGENPDKWELFRDFNQSAIVSDALGFVFDPTPVKAEVAACANVINEFDRAIGNGILDPDTAIDDYVAKLKANGADKIIEEKKKQYEAWKQQQ